ncbi:MAG: monofunctional biosynthetic peptidoglycan transglycosylase [Deltaproteobacteria bacterium]|nr:monofunctional biosynthetic peptidoglycan transglycosylase [Deltaproteobacteria bacterium]
MLKRKRRQLFLSAIATVGLLWLLILYAQLTIPNVQSLKIENPATTAFMKRYEGKQPLKFEWVPYSKIAPSLKQAVVVAEDGTFFEHHGFDWQAIRQAIEKNWRKKELARGGSTITQQLAKNLYLSPSKNPLRKIREVLISIGLEQHLSKQRILEIYLNVVEWGDGIYGAHAAARHYFNVNASELNPRQSAWLAAILPNPKYYEKHRAGAFLQRKTAKIAGVLGYKPAELEPVKPSAPPLPPVDIYDDMPYEEKVEEF